MTTTEIPDHLIRKAADAMWTRIVPGSKYSADSWDDCREDARAALSAVADDLRAEGAREALDKARKAQAEALREAARYFAAGLHCADMRTTPEETVHHLNRLATEYETGEDA